LSRCTSGGLSKRVGLHPVGYLVYNKIHYVFVFLSVG
jgi:hypothetical protein